MPTDCEPWPGNKKAILDLDTGMFGVKKNDGLFWVQPVMSWVVSLVRLR
jgi:hypothetical protein